MSVMPRYCLKSADLEQQFSEVLLLPWSPMPGTQLSALGPVLVDINAPLKQACPGHIDKREQTQFFSFPLSAAR